MLEFLWSSLPLSYWDSAFTSLTFAASRSDKVWSTMLFAVLWSICASVDPLLTESPTSAPKNNTSPDAFDLIST